eukprot:TRINITY_DN1027_c0_g1_i1.p1 TRINITY_DN1027_c0_g1~~TRINITY_DN1027_c0_g1_i1.p1  ORF type:complete len:297 (+),score=95.71 TRINITY_DN1027_c0_g1_i1:75-893(+)
MTDVIEEVPTFDLSMKKKKKKKVVKADEVTEGVAALDIKDKEEGEAAEAPVEEAEPEMADGEFSGKKKKKKSSSKRMTTITKDEDDTSSASTSGDAPSTSEDTSSTSTSSPWLGSDRDYTYEELANRIFNMLHNSNPDLAKTKKYTMKPPQVCRVGTKQTVWINFAEICSIMRRKPDHVLNYVLAELGTNGSVDGLQRLVIKGRFQPKGLENVLRHYIAEYVACHTCKSPDTVMQKENRLYFLQCEACGSRRSVNAIKKGFEAQIGKRKKDK